MQRVQPRPSIQPIIKFIFSPRFVGLETFDKVRRLFLFPISKQNKNLGFSHVKSGNPDTSRYFVLSGRSAVVWDYTANFSQTKKIVNLPGSGVFFSTQVKKKIRNSEKIRRWPIPGKRRTRTRRRRRRRRKRSSRRSNYRF